MTDPLLDQLLAATPYPPESGIDDLLVAVAEMLARRDILLAGLSCLPAGPDDRPILDELARRDAAWRHALSVAHQELGAQRVAATKARAYARDPF